MDFEFDPANSAANLKKHSIDFTGAQAPWSSLVHTRRESANAVTRIERPVSAVARESHR